MHEDKKERMRRGISRGKERKRKIIKEKLKGMNKIED